MRSLGALDGKVAIITGSSRGIGRAVALCFAEEGASVVVNYSRSQEQAEAVVRTIRERGGNAIAVRADVAVSDDVRAMVRETVDLWGRIDILMNNAGIAADGPAEEMSEDDWDRVVDVSLKGTFLCTQAVAPIMRRQKSGKVINVSAASAIRGRMNGVNFCAAKGGVIALTKCFARELAPHVQVNCFLPGFTETEDVVERFGLRDPKVRAELVKEIPLGRLAKAEEMARGALFLASSDSDLMTGQLLMINGGSYM